ncbi:hypothetical protein ACMFL9_05935 (plasmid) [Sinorhizobium meliloti]
MKALERTFREVRVFGDFEEDTAPASLNVLLQVIVTTPKRCLMLLSMQPEVFSELGLIVFHECHLLHVRKDDSSQLGLLEGSRVLKA